jgi:pyruvate-formate lyase-activating enzyme
MASWHECRFLTCSVLPVRMACNCRCAFCFSRSSVSALAADAAEDLDLGWYFDYSRERGASRLVVTGGGEPLLRQERVLEIVRRGREWFSEIALFTNAAFLDAAYAGRLRAAGLSYLCYSRHHYDDDTNRRLMGPGAPPLDRALAAAGPLPVRATCVMARGFVDSREQALRYVDALSRRGVREFTFKHTYVAYPRSVFAGTPEDRWAADHHVDFDPFAGEGGVAAQLPWGPKIRVLGELKVCYYWEPTPEWERENGICRSLNLLSDGSVYASLEDAASLLFRLGSSAPPSPSRT